MAVQDEQEKSASELRSELKHETEGALLEAIKGSAGQTVRADHLRDLAEAYALVMAGRPARSGATQQAGRTVASR